MTNGQRKGDQGYDRLAIANAHIARYRYFIGAALVALSGLGFKIYSPTDRLVSLESNVAQLQNDPHPPGFDSAIQRDDNDGACEVRMPASDRGTAGLPAIPLRKTA